MPAIQMHAGIFEVSLTRYFEAFALRERGALMAALAHCMSDDAEIWGPQRLFEGVDLPALGYTCTQHVATPSATHIVLARR